MGNHFNEFLNPYGYHLNDTDKGTKLQAVRYSSDTFINSLRDEAILQLLTHAKFRKQGAFTYSQMLQLAQPTQPDVFRKHLRNLLYNSHLLNRGYLLRCHHCTLQHWYALAHTTEKTRCAGCRSHLKIPLDADFAYRANPLFADALRNGGLSVWLMVNYLRRTIQHNSVISLCTDIRGQGIDTDMDVIMLCGFGVEDMVFAECKDRLPPASDATLQRQIDSLAAIAKNLNVRAYLATLDATTDPPDNLPDTVQFISREMLLTTG